MKQPVFRRRITVGGLVQGIGFRPHVYTLADRFHLTGFVQNDARGVVIEIQGPDLDLDRFESALRNRELPRVRLDTFHSESLEPLVGEERFQIRTSNTDSPELTGATDVSPDVAICEACLAEFRDPGNRRFGYPLIQCAHCGPRFTMIRTLPYDRARTTMSWFPMCPCCAAEYVDPADRRFHAEPIACPRCGPTLSFRSRAGDVVQGDEAVRRARQWIAEGRIVAVKGIGGFHLACDATLDSAVSTLRARKGRWDKPFAILCADMRQVRQLARVSDDEERLLRSAASPIVLLQASAPTSPLPEDTPVRLSAHVAPGSGELGIMLAYSGIHFSLLDDRPLVMTSGNRTDEPIARDNGEALDRLAELADGFLIHDREIVQVCDDSVMRVVDGQSYPIRRSRGYVPDPIRWHPEISAQGSVLAVGADVKSTFCLTRGGHAYLSPHLGDMGSPETQEFLERTLDHYVRLLTIRPTRIACDAHPDYFSRRWAESYASRHHQTCIQVQHHHAHLASLIAEHQRPPTTAILAVCFDGSGYGSDGAIWGGELLCGNAVRCDRLAHLDYFPLPGGDAAVRKPYRAALGCLFANGCERSSRLASVLACADTERLVLEQQLKRNVLAPPTSSMGRLFDVMASLIGLRQDVTYEGQAALELESIADLSSGAAYPLPIQDGVVTLAGLLHAVLEDLDAGVSRAAISGRFHRAVADLVIAMARLGRSQTGIRTIGLTGGVFQNRALVHLIVPRLRDDHFEVLLHRLVPANDGGIALGQALIASLR